MLVSINKRDFTNFDWFFEFTIGATDNTIPYIRTRCFFFGSSVARNRASSKNQERKVQIKHLNKNVDSPFWENIGCHHHCIWFCID